MYIVIYSKYYSWRGFVKFTSSNVKYIKIKDKSDFNQDTQYYINLVTSCCCVARMMKLSNVVFSISQNVDTALCGQ